MNPPPSTFHAPAAPRPLRRTAFTLVELMIGMSLTAFLLVAAFSGVVSLQKSYAATEGYGTGLADQMRLLDYLAQDLRRAVAAPASAQPWTLDADGQGIQITVPDYYRFNSTDPQHLFPIANDPIYDATTGVAHYGSPAASGSLIPATTKPNVNYPVIAYRYRNGVITRTDPWQPLVADGHGGYQSAGPQTIATSMDAFPDIQPDTDADPSGNTLRCVISFYSTFQPLAVRGGNHTGTITLHNVTFIRSKNLAR